MTTDLTVRPDQQMTVLTNEQLQFIASTEFVPPGLRGNLPAILACVATGRALGIPDMTALRSIHVIDGKATFSAELMVMLARQRGHSIQGDVTEGKATVTGKRADNGDTMTVEWTLGMAERAGLLGKSNWKKYPESMLWARAVSQLCRELFADCFAGATYTPEELEDSAGVPTAGPVAGGDPPPVPQAAREGESATPAEHIHAAAREARGDQPPVDIADPDIPFGDAAFAEHQPHNPASVKQKKKLDVLVKGGESPPALRRVYATVGRMRKAKTDALIEQVGGLDEDGTLHWAPLRDSLSFGEAHELIDRLERVES